MKYAFAHILLAAAFSAIGCAVCWFMVVHLAAEREFTGFVGLMIGVMWWLIAETIRKDDFQCK